MFNSIGMANIAAQIASVEEEGLGIDAPMVVPLRASDMQEWTSAVRNEPIHAWLGDDEAWTTQTQASWEGVVPIPESELVIEINPAVDYQAQVVEVDFIFAVRAQDGSIRTKHTSVNYPGLALRSA